GRLLQAIAIFIYAIPTSGVTWNLDKIVTVVLMLIGGFLVFSGLFIVYASICFFTIEGLEFMNIFTDGGREFGKYPLSIYGEGVLKFLTYIVPIALFQYYPFLYLIGRTDTVGYMFLPLVGIVFLIPCLIFWRIGIRHYKSTGS
ncbi:MAG: ABC-2 family transporter protein, partial [Eubacteriales bacterium]|nr:ABC-2 family transporter protein [Eubacteriales bacterium]